MLAHYVAAFAKLRTDKSAVRWTSDTQFRAPHKPFLLLAVLDLVAQGVITTNFIQLTGDLVESFELYWRAALGQPTTSTPVYPFFYLKSDRFWHLLPTPGNEVALAAIAEMSSFRQLHQLVLGAALDAALWDLLQIPTARDALRRVLVDTYFAPDVQPRVVAAGQAIGASFAYSQALLDRRTHTFQIKEPAAAAEQYRGEVRSTAFRRVIVQAYNHTCAVCGIRVLTPEGRTAVAAAHIVPWRESHNDDPRNGLALCGLHHWTFDQGLITVDDRYRVAVSAAVEHDTLTEPLRVLDNHTIERPADPFLWPAPDALRWHRRHIFRAEGPTRLL